MRKSTIVVLVAVIAAAVIGAAVFVAGGDDTPDVPDVPATGGTSAVVWFDDGTNEPESAEAEGKDLRSLLEAGIPGHEIEFMSNGNVASVDGKENTSDRRWVAFRWSSPEGWRPFEDTPSEYVDGMNVALRYAERLSDAGAASYSLPEIEVEYEVHFFLQIREHLDDTEWLEALPISDRTKQEGVWISGTGCNANEALADAVLKTFFPGSKVEVQRLTAENGLPQVDYVVDGKKGMFSYGENPSSFGWFVEFLGWGDTLVNGDGGEYGTWCFWNQFNYSPDAKTMDDSAYWEFNNLSWGLYDITEYHYMGLVLRTSDHAESTIDFPPPSEMPRGL